jgi:hypothetical protein
LWAWGSNKPGGGLIQTVSAAAQSAVRFLPPTRLLQQPGEKLLAVQRRGNDYRLPVGMSVGGPKGKDLADLESYNMDEEIEK